MLKRLRLNSKDAIDDTSLRPRTDSATILTGHTEVEGEESTLNRVTFFDLPAELRNAIYEYIVSDTILTLPSSGYATSSKARLPLKKRKNPPPPVNSLLLTSRQCHQEFSSVLLSSVRVIVEVRDFDFENLIRVSAGLGETDLKALQSNRNLNIHFFTQNCTSKALHSLRRWLSHRATSQSAARSLPWKYDIPSSILPPTSFGRVRLLRELEYYADTLSRLAVDIDEGQQWELRSIIDAFGDKAAWLEDDLGWLGQRSKSYSRNVRGLAGGGIM